MSRVTTLRARKPVDYKEGKKSPSGDTSCHLTVETKKKGRKPAEHIESTPVLSDYEKMVMEHREKRNKLMVEMGLAEAITDLKKCVNAKKARLETKKPKPEKANAPALPSREPSKRIQALQRINYSEDECTSRKNVA